MDSYWREQIARHRAGDGEATEALARRVLKLALGPAAAVLGSRDEASDVAQEVAVEALRGLPGLRDPDRFEAWVHRLTVRHTGRALGRRDRRRSEQLLPDVDPPSPDDEGGGGDADALRRALAGLSERQRIALALRYVNDLSESEVAAAMGCSTGTVASLLSRGRALLRRHPALAEIRLGRSQGGTP
jgi:RNA polymerase sigma factor (sigma-70 family)